MSNIQYEYTGFDPYIVETETNFITELEALLPEGAVWGQEANTLNSPYYGVKFGEHFMYVLYDNPCIVNYNSQDEKEWGQVVEAVLAKMNEISIKVFEYPAVITDDDM